MNAEGHLSGALRGDYQYPTAYRTIQLETRTPVVHPSDRSLMLADLPSQPPHDPLQTRSQDPPRQHHHDPQLTTRLQDTPKPPPQATSSQHHHDPQVITRLQDMPTVPPQATPTPPPQDTLTQPLHDSQSSPTLPAEPVSEPDVPPPYSVLPINNRQPLTLESQTLSIHTSQTPDPTMNPPTLAISLPQAPSNPVRDERGRSVVQALKATLHLMCTTLEKASLPIPRVQDFLRVNLDVIDLIEEINAQFIVLENRYSTSEELQRKIDSIARSADEFVPALSKLVKGRSLENSRSAGDDRILVADFLRRIKEELDSWAFQNDAAGRAGSTAPSETAPEVRVTLQHVEGGVSVRIDMQSGSRDALSSMTIGSTVPRPPSPSFHEDAKRVSLPHNIPPFETLSSRSWDDLPSTIGATNPQRTVFGNATRMIPRFIKSLHSISIPLFLARKVLGNDGVRLNRGIAGELIVPREAAAQDRGPETPDVGTMRTFTIVHLCDTKVLERPQGVGKETAEADKGKSYPTFCEFFASLWWSPVPTFSISHISSAKVTDIHFGILNQILVARQPTRSRAYTLGIRFKSDGKTVLRNISGSLKDKTHSFDNKAPCPRLPGEPASSGRRSYFRSWISRSMPPTTNSEDDLGSSEDRLSDKDFNREMSVSNFPSRDSKLMNPFAAINSYLLEKDPSLDIVVTHDEEWMKIIQGLAIGGDTTDEILWAQIRDELDQRPLAPTTDSVSLSIDAAADQDSDNHFMVRPRDILRIPLHDLPNSPTAFPRPISEPHTPPPYSIFPPHDPPSSTPDSQRLSTSLPQAPGHSVRDERERNVVQALKATFCLMRTKLGKAPSRIPRVQALTGLHSSSTSRMSDPTTNPSTLAISLLQAPGNPVRDECEQNVVRPLMSDPAPNPSTLVLYLPQDPGNPVRDEREQNVVPALKATLRLMCTTLEKAPSLIPRVQTFLGINLDVVDLIKLILRIEISSAEQDIYDSMEEINAHFAALIKHFSVPEELQREIDSIASINEFVPALPKLLKRRLLEHSWIARDDRLLVALFIRRIKDQLDSQAAGLSADSGNTLSSLKLQNNAADPAASTSTSGAFWVPLQELEGGFRVYHHPIPTGTENERHFPDVLLFRGLKYLPCGIGANRQAETRIVISPSATTLFGEGTVSGGTFFFSHNEGNLRNFGRIMWSITFPLATFNAPYGRQLAKVMNGWSGMISVNPLD
ncbi:hypothetical protein ARMSODRAFT_1068418 [Armillaria solidipes]|uniref:Uncharacterized protein n=1 Tax=Armillaria solidipes TaxID=1076256 RepID=A0A2H3B7L6_9AGAR|nr:hypothetical protein ARMSODRAFT_1068418 [Armillaria solidipes]